MHFIIFIDTVYKHTGMNGHNALCFIFNRQMCQHLLPCLQYGGTLPVSLKQHGDGSYF